MNSLLNDIVLEPVVCDQVVIPLENKYYDPTMKFAKMAGRENNALTFDIDKIISQYSADLSDILRLTVPAALYMRRRGQQQQVPTLWEMGGLNRSSFNRPSWCIIIGSADGGRVSRHDVCQVRYPSFDRTMHPSGRHALSAVQAETMFIVAQNNNTMTIALVYKIDNVESWSPGFSFQMPMRDRYGERNYVALNCSLVGIRQLKNGEVSGWADKNRLNTAEQNGIARLFRLAQEKLSVPALAACNLEMFWDAASNSTDKNQHEAPENTDVTNYTVAPEDFVAEIIGRIGEYRKHLNSSDLPIKAHPIPASVHYERKEDDTVDVFVEVPSALKTYGHFSISTKLSETLPATLLAEQNLLNNYTTFDDLLVSLEIDQPLSRNIFTFS